MALLLLLLLVQRTMPSTGGAVSAWDTIIKHTKRLAAAHARGDPPTSTVPAVYDVLKLALDIPLAELKQDKIVKLVVRIKVRWQGRDITCIQHET